jgi:putative hydrolase of HD superfamily
MTKAEKILELLRHGESLKNIERTGWILAKVDSKRIESVAEHSYGTVLSSIIIAQHLKSEGVEIKMQKVVIMAALHDLPESITGDIARTETFAKDPKRMKKKELAEKDALKLMLEPFDDEFENLHQIWNEFNIGESIESRIVRGADIIDMLLHARELEDSGASTEALHQFFESSKALIETISIEIITEIYKTLCSEHRMQMQSQSYTNFKLFEITMKSCCFNTSYSYRFGNSTVQSELVYKLFCPRFRDS